MTARKEKVVYVLSSWGGAMCGVYTSMAKLEEGVAYWIIYQSKHEPKLVLTYEEWILNYVPEPSSWDWAYISPDCTWKELAKGGRTVPFPKWLGKNLINQKWDGIET